MAVTLSAGVRQNLLSLQSTSSQLETTQNRLATGKRVNSALDNPNSFFTASALSSRAADLSNLLDDEGQAIQTLKAADTGIQSITKLVEAAKAKANQALQTSDAAQRTTYQGEFNVLLRQIEQTAADSSYKGKNLLKGTTTLTVNFNEDASSKLDITGVDYAATNGLGIADATWTDDTSINTSLTAIKTASDTLRTQASTFGTNLTIVQNRQDFTSALISTLQTGADKLTLADQNEEGANLLALKTRQSLATTALSFASQADQNVLRLF
jgi:flagellin